ncbi:MAG: FAD-dependent oxidoreductase [Candidatus Dadabacteria bacterium]|nr:MAG: FAD-dependent oxidoreductase [Candidatus Dadabacteria bacterium]
MKRRFEAIVVGAGPAGAAAAVKLAREGVDVALVERGAFAGEKNMFGGLLHRMPALEELFPDFWARAPVERHVVQKNLCFLTGEASFTVRYETEAFDRPPYNGYTVFRPRYDAWLAQEAQSAGATYLTRCTVDDVILESGRVSGVRLLRDGGELRAPVVIAADGVLSFTALKAGLRRGPFDPDQMAVGVKALVDLPKAVLEDRFGLVRDQGASVEFVGCTDGVRGGGFLYTNSDSVSVGLVLHIGSLRRSRKTPYDLLNRFLTHPHLAKLLQGGRLSEYSAHVIPEGGYEMIPQLAGDGILVAGDAAGFCYANGLNLEGINLAAHSGILAAETVLRARRAGEFSARVLGDYRRRLAESFVLRDLKLYRRAPRMLHLDRLYGTYPELLCEVMERVYRIDGTPKEKLPKLFLRKARQKVSTRELLADAWLAWRSV